MERFGDWGNEVLETLPQDYEQEEAFVFTPEKLPEVPGEMCTKSIVVQRNHKIYYGHWREDQLWFYADHKTYARLGIWILATLFHPEPTLARLRLDNQHSQLRWLQLECEYPASYPYESLTLVPAEFTYWVDQRGYFPSASEDVDPFELPQIRLSNSDDYMVNDEDFQNRDVAWGFGSLGGTLRMARLFLDISRPANQNNQYNLETEAGVRGLAPASAELKLLLPDGDSLWSEDWFEGQEAD